MTWSTSIFPDFVEFRSLSSSGIYVVRVILVSSNPRILAFFEDHSGGRETREIPTSLFIDEILEFVRIASSLRVEGGPPSEKDLFEIQSFSSQSSGFQSLKELLMRNGECEVSSKSIVVGKAEFPIFETVDEAVATLGTAEVIERLNAQVKTDAMNRVRSAATGQPSKESLRQEALASITQEEFSAVAGDKVKFAALVQKKMDEIEKVRLANLPKEE